MKAPRVGFILYCIPNARYDLLGRRRKLHHGQPSEEKYQMLVDACEAWWNRQFAEEQIRIRKESAQ